MERKRERDGGMEGDACEGTQSWIGAREVVTEWGDGRFVGRSWRERERERGRER
jgi:hypothetical protein